MKRLVGIGFAVIGLAAFLAGLVALLFFKAFYLACPEFNSEGKCFDPIQEVVYHEQSFYWLPIGLVALLLAVSLLLLSRRFLKGQRASD